MSELILVRHGQASFGQKSYDKLSDLGIEQVRILARHWQTVGEEFDHIYSGSLVRQQETAQKLLSLVKNNPDHAKTHLGLNEYNGDSLIKAHLRDIGELAESDYEFGSTIRDVKTFQSIFEDATAKWIRDQLKPPENESNFEYWKQFKQRVCGALDEIMSQHSSGSRVLISTSGGVIAMALQRVLKFADDQVIQTNWVVHNSSVTRIRYGNGKISLAQFNCLPHLDTTGMQQYVTYR